MNVRENRRGSQDWTIHRHRQCWEHKTQGKDKQSKNTQHRKLKRWITRTPPKNGGNTCFFFKPIAVKIYPSVVFIVISFFLKLNKENKPVCHRW